MPSREVLAELAREQGLDLLGSVSATVLVEPPDVPFFREWLQTGYHADMHYLTGERAAIRADLDRLLPGTRSIICAAINYSAAVPYSTELPETTRAWIARYAWGDDYHDVLKTRLEALVAAMRARLTQPFEARVCVDTSPVLERSLARHSGVGWLAKNTCIINQKLGSWLLLGEVLTTLELPADASAPDRCGSCTRCLDACPTQALVAPRVLDSRRCISYWTIEHRGSIPQEARAGMGRHVFGCDICQDVCPWNQSAPVTHYPAFQPRDGLFNPPLEQLARITEDDFRRIFRNSPVRRAKYRGFLRNVCVAMGNSGDSKFIADLERLSVNGDALIAEHAQWALAQIREKNACAVV